MSPERQKIVIFSGNCHLSDWSAAGWDVVVRVDGERVVEMADGFESGGEQRDVFGSGDASARIKRIIDGFDL